ncbi:MAG: aminotransferase class IV [Chloroflexi bacterium]|nr:aminotransferase class IV [Chloroflexota bacterium]
MVCLNGSLVPLSEAHLSPMDHGFLYGYGLFETMRAYSGHVFRLEAHLARLRRAAAFLGLGMDHLPDLSRAIHETMEANHLGNARIRLTLSGGRGEPVPDMTACREPTLLITARDYVPHADAVYRQGFRAVLSTIRRNTRSPLSGLKSLSCLDNLLARREARLAGDDEAIMLNEQGFVGEGSTSNVFLVSGNTLRTPGEDSGILPGITRGAVLELARSAGLDAAECRIDPGEFISADEAFCTNSLIEIMPITSFGGQAVGRGVPGKVTARLTAAYREMVAAAGRTASH